MANTKIKNEFQKYWHPEKFKKLPDWHERTIGIYHISTIGCSHQDIDWDEHSGPCLRETFFEYTDIIPDSDSTEGNYEQGKDIHKGLQKIIKAWKPNTIIEYPLAQLFEKDGMKILLVGSIDILYKHLYNLLKDTSTSIKKISIWDIKSTSEYTIPKGRYDKNPTHFDQVDLYGIFILLFEFDQDKYEIKRVKIIYVDKHNKGTYIQRKKFNMNRSMNKLGDCVARAFYLHSCLLKNEVPVPEPHKWCKYCKYLVRCQECGGVEPIMKGAKNPKLVGLKIL